MTSAIESLIDIALSSMRNGPKPLMKVLEFFAKQEGLEGDPMQMLRERLAAKDPNDPAIVHLALRVHKWDHVEFEPWTDRTGPNSSERRSLIHRCLALTEADGGALDLAVPEFTRGERATVVAERHEPWYWQRKQPRSFYWEAYAHQLSATGSGWSTTAIGILNDSTDDIVARLSDPTRAEIYPIKGLVMGYVQSGKTAHFTGVIAKALDAGYRLVIVLAGTLDILRRQTQRRLDKELVGQELLAGDEDYLGDQDWKSFVSHGGRPSDQGAFDIERLTGLAEDYKRLGVRVSALSASRTRIDRPFNDPENLARAPARLIVLKKIPRVIERLARDLQALREKGERLTEIPTLVIDDESDQASINVTKPSQAGQQQRTRTNGAIIDLLKSLPRAQYVGYTATPFANVFIDPNDAEQLFPKDFIVSLPRPQGYMGVADFYDLDADPAKPGPNEQRYVRSVKGADDDRNNLPKALDSFVLAGALKLYRSNEEPARYTYRHHTMLVHHAALKAVHERQREEIEALFRSRKYLSPAARVRLSELFEADFKPNLDHSLPRPKSFKALEPFIAKCVAKIQADKAVRIVNGDESHRDDTPDFDTTSVWAILVGGTKLSRGYTVEGLTTSYYRRRAGAGDTLMQMGRWFGFRPGYSDLVRWFVGREEPVGQSSRRVDLYVQFGALCRDEEAFRKELQRYADNGDILPKQVPPLVHSHLPGLRPTSKNKMYNAEITFKNMGGQWKEKVAVSEREALHNQGVAAQLLGPLTLKRTSLAGVLDGRAIALEALIAGTSNTSILSFLEQYKWSNGAKAVQYELEYIRGTAGDPGIKNWLVLIPQLKGQGKAWPQLKRQIPNATVIERTRPSDSSFNVYSDPIQRAFAVHISRVDDQKLSGTNGELEHLSAASTAVLFLYLVREKGSGDSAKLSVGFAMQFPKSKLRKEISWGVKNKAARDAVVIDAV